MKKNIKMLTKQDIILILFFFFIIFLSYMTNNIKDKKSYAKYISATVNGKEIVRFKMNENIETRQYPIRTQYGFNLLEISNKGVRVLEASCPDKLDVKQGYIKNVGEQIICLPNRLIVSIYSEKSELDFISR